MIAPFEPRGPLLRNAHVQSTLASLSPRRRRWQRRDGRMEAASRPHRLDCGDGVRLEGYHSPHPQPRGLVVLIHGWEGCHESNYLYGMACACYAAGFSVFRLNLRDHGGTHALNEAPFHSARIAEVIGAVRAASVLEPSLPLVVLGFSLGGSFSLRVGLMGPSAGVTPALSIGVSPSINPGATLEAIDTGSPIYRRYFLRKWQQTLANKAAAWPDRYDFSPLTEPSRFVEVTRRFVEGFTEYPSYETYLGAYTLTPSMLMDAPSPLAVLTAQDDPVIPIGDFDGLTVRDSLVAYAAPAHGGHCGFIDSWSLESWAERWVIDLLDTRLPV